MNKSNKSNKVQFIVGVLIVFVLLVLTLSLRGVHRTPPSLYSDDTINIGWIGPLTGEAAVVGIDSAKMAQLAVDAVNAEGGINGRMVNLIQEDDQYSTPKSISAYEKLVNINGVKIILMQTYGSIFALADRANQDGVVLMGVLDSNDNLAQLGNHVFSIGVESESISRLLAGHANDQGHKKAGILYFGSDTFMPYIKDVFTSLFDGESIAEGYVAGTQDFKTSLSKMKEGGIDVFVCLGYDECGNAIYQARTLGIDAPLLMPGTVMSPALGELAKGNTEGAIFTFWLGEKDREPTKTVISKFEAREGRQPFVDVFSFSAYDAMQVIVTALSSPEVDSIDSLTHSIRSTRGLEGITGEINFSKDGTARIPFRLFTLRGQVPVEIK